MQERSRKKKQGKKDENQLAIDIVTQATKDKNPAAVALGRLGGKKGGPARARKLSKERLREIALKAARARWHKGESS